jgi:glycosyltransferase involved in cell wall biosynthesis
MKIAFIVGGLPFGGIANLLKDITLELKRKGCDPVVINLSGTGCNLEDFLANNIQVLNISNSVKALKTHRIDTLIKLRRIIKTLYVDIIHTMEFSGDYFGRIASLNLKIPVVTHIHNINRQRKLHRRLANKLLSFKTDLFISVSEEVKKVVDLDHNIAKRKNIVLYNGLYIKKFRTLENLQEHAKNTNIIICVGRLVKQKNFDLVIKAFNCLKETFKDLELWIVGDGKEKDNLKRLIDELNLNDKVKLLGFRTDIPEMLEKACIFLLPSDYEGLPVSHLEAMHMGLPAIISKFVPSREIASECSLICETNSVDIAEKISMLLSDKNLYSSLSNKAKEIAKNFTIEQYVKKLLSAYEELLN